MKNRKISIIGLGYVGLPLAVAFGKKQTVIGYDISQQRIQELLNGIDKTNEVSIANISLSNVQYTNNISELKHADFHIVAVPTPIDRHNQPNLLPLKYASTDLGAILKKGDIVVFESTVFPGATEEICVPLLQESSGLRCGVDFHVGYSPERINPGDKKRTLKDIIKVVSAQSPSILDIISAVYGQVIKAGIFKAKSIKVAEAAKVIENTQRDINIAFMNELNIIFDRLDINIYDVLAAAKTKWNFIDFTPGLVGGHCIGVDPYYLSYKATEMGSHPEMILSGRRLNDGMSKYYAGQLVKKMISHNIDIYNARVGIFGFSFKENCPDVRNTKVIKVVNELQSYHINVLVHDPVVDEQDVLTRYGIQLTSLSKMCDLDAVLIAVPHDNFRCLNFHGFMKNNGVLYDIKNMNTDQCLVS